MNWWTTIKSWLGIGAKAAVGGATGNPLGVAQAGLEAVAEVGKDIREGNRNATERAISKQKDETDAAIDGAIKKATSNGAALGIALGFVLAGLSVGGCASVPSRDSAPTSGNVARLLARPDFDAAAKAAPEWTRDSLKTVNSLEADLQRERARANQVR